MSQVCRAIHGAGVSDADAGCAEPHSLVTEMKIEHQGEAVMTQGDTMGI